jgi:hypothetical protein
MRIFPSKKTSITLSKALELREALQNKLKSNHGILKLENSVFKGQKRNYDLKSIDKENGPLQEQLIKLKLIIQAANLIIPENEKFPISYYVYLLSEKNTAILNFTSMLREALEGVGEDKKGNKVTYDKPIFTRPELEDRINTLRKECRTMELKLTDLNKQIIVEIPFKTNLV